MKHHISIAYRIFKRLYPEKNLSPVFRHCLKVLSVVRTLCDDLDTDDDIIFLGALLHDIGRLAELPHPMCHGIEGQRIILEEEMLDFICSGKREQIAFITRNHIGCGITEMDIKSQGLPLPYGDYMPSSIEELIVSFADNVCFGEKIMGINFVFERFSKELGVEYAQRVHAQARSIQAAGVDLTFLY